jgi:uncharacterized protein (DUF1697 family)
MSTYIAFLRALNVGGRNASMADLRQCMSEAGFEDVETYIQSGNLRVSSPVRGEAKVAEAIEGALAQRCGFEVPAILRTPAQLTSTVEASPQSLLGADARHYVAFLRMVPSGPAREALDAWKVDGERLQIVGRDLHIWLTKPSHQAKATNARLEKLAGTLATTRSWTVVSALASRWGAPA